MLFTYTRAAQAHEVGKFQARPASATHSSKAPTGESAKAGGGEGGGGSQGGAAGAGWGAGHREGRRAIGSAQGLLGGQASVGGGSQGGAAGKREGRSMRPAAWGASMP